MTLAPRPLFLALAVAGAAGLGLTNRGGAQTDLPKSSPFMSVGGPAAPTAAIEAIEFAAVRTIGKRTEIDLYDTQGKKHHWVPLGGTADGMSVLSYDVRHDQVIAKIDGTNKTLRLRQTKGVAAGTAAVAMQPAMSFATPAGPDTTFVQPLRPPTPTIAFTPATDTPATAGPVAPTAAAPTPAQPAIPLTVARQEEEARMLVSDLLEIGMAQRKAYEDKQKQGANPNAPAPAATADTPAPVPVPNPNGPPSGG